MNTYTDKTSEHKSQTVASSLPKQQGRDQSTFQFEDNRPEAIAQRKLQNSADHYVSQQLQPIQKKENNTGLPDNLKNGIENLSGFSMDDVKVHYNSDKPAQLQAHAYAQGTDIHVASGQEKHLPHEAWHVVQQKQGRVQPTMQMKGGLGINEDKGLEREADLMGEGAIRTAAVQNNKITNNSSGSPSEIVQMYQYAELDALGKRWFGEVMLAQVRNDDLRNAIMADVLALTGFGMGSPYPNNWRDPYLHGAGAYKNLIVGLTAQDARLLYDFFVQGTDSTTLINDNVRKLAVIIGIAETGRGYLNAGVHEAAPYLEEIANLDAAWNDIKNRFQASLTGAEDGEYIDGAESDEDEEHVDGGEAQEDEIDADEIRDLNEDKRRGENFPEGTLKSRKRFKS